jgi:hypothetical protein
MTNLSQPEKTQNDVIAMHKGTKCIYFKFVNAKQCSQADRLLTATVKPKENIVYQYRTAL